MESLLDTYRKNVRQRSLFTEIVDIDFYDGPTEALCQLVDSRQWLICSLIYFDIKKGERIFTLLEISNEWLLKFKSILEKRSIDQAEVYEKLKEEINSFYNAYSGKLFLFKSNWLNAIEYEVIEIPLTQLEYFKDIEGVLEQSEESKLKWINFFPK